MRGVLVAQRWASALLRSCEVAVSNGLAVLVWNYTTPSGIIGAAKKLALTLGLAACFGYASFDKAALAVELTPAYSAVEHGSILTVRARSWSHNAASIEQPGEFGETLNVVTNDTPVQTLSQYRAEPLLKGTEGVTTSAWSLSPVQGMAVKRHEPPARKGRDSLSYAVTHRSADKEPHANSSDSDWDRLNIAQSDVLSAAEYTWKQIAMHIVASGRELRINSGETQIAKLVAARMKNAMRSFDNSFSSDLYSAGSLSNQIGGLQHIVADTNTNTVGGIDANTWTFWRNTVFDLSSNSVIIGSTTIENDAMLPLWLSIDRGAGDSPDLIIMDTTYFTYFEKSQTSLKRYANADEAQAGLVSMKYKTADVTYDTSGSGIPSAHAYFLNTNYLKLVVHEDADLDEMPKKNPIDQDGEVVPLIWMGNLTCSNRKLQGVIIA